MFWQVLYLATWLEVFILRLSSTWHEMFWTLWVTAVNTYPCFQKNAQQKLLMACRPGLYCNAAWFWFILFYQQTVQDERWIKWSVDMMLYSSFIDNGSASLKNKKHLYISGDIYIKGCLANICTVYLSCVQYISLWLPHITKKKKTMKYWLLVKVKI